MIINLRRIYIYLVGAITLQSVTWALIALLRNVTQSSRGTPPASMIATQVAILLVGTPLFLAHWIWAQRIASREEDERRSAVRRLYLNAMLLAFIFPALNSSILLMQLGIDNALGAYAHIITPRPGIWYYLIAIGVTVILALYHGFIRRKDGQTVEPEEAAVILDQLFIYILSLAGLALTAIGVSQLLRILAELPSTTASQPGRIGDTSTYLSLVIAGLPIWIISWRQAQRRFASGERREQSSVVRKAVLYLIVLLSSLSAVITIAVLLANFLLQALGVPSSEGDWVDALIIIIVSSVIWAYHAHILRKDANAAETVGQAALVRRIYQYLISAVGLSAVLIGIGGILSVLIRSLDSPGLGPNLREQLAWFTATLAAGLPVWLVNWRRIQNLVTTQGQAGNEERSAFTRRLYLTIFAFVAILTLLGGAVYVVSQIVELILGSRSTNGLFTDIGQALAYSLIAVAVLIYHGLLLRSDQRALEEEKIKAQSQYTVAVVDSGSGQLGQFLIEKLQQELPGIQIAPIPITQRAKAAMLGEGEEANSAKLLANADIIITPWQFASDAEDELVLDEEISDAYYQSTAHRLLLPQPQAGVTWIGVEPWEEREISKDIIHAVQQIARGEKPVSGRKMSIVVIVLASLCGLTMLFQLVVVLINLLLEL